jgi:hypothetical protein
MYSTQQHWERPPWEVWQMNITAALVKEQRMNVHISSGKGGTVHEYAQHLRWRRQGYINMYSSSAKVVTDTVCTVHWTVTMIIEWCTIVHLYEYVQQLWCRSDGWICTVALVQEWRMHMYCSYGTGVTDAYVQQLWWRRDGSICTASLVQEWRINMYSSSGTGVTDKYVKQL